MNFLAGLGSLAFLALYEASGAAQAARAADARAARCEIFVDKVEVGAFAVAEAIDATQALEPRFYLKILTDRLDGPIVRVGASGRRTLNGSAAAPRQETWEAGAFVGSSDYFSLSLGSFAPMSGFAVAWEGAFFVETASGQRLWANNHGPNPDFVITRHLVERARAATDPAAADASSSVSLMMSMFHADVGRILKTADAFVDLNPSRCR